MCDLCNNIKEKRQFFNSVQHGEMKFGIVKNDGDNELVFYPEDDPYYSSSIKISYCPKCGRRL